MLHEVLARVASTMAFHRGGALAISRAIRSREVATVQLSSGASVIGVVQAAWTVRCHRSCVPGESTDRPRWRGKGAITPKARALPRAAGANKLVVIGRLEGGPSLDAATDERIGTQLDVTTGRHRFRFDRGSVVEGRLLRTVRHADGRLMVVELADARVTLPDAPPRDMERYALVAGGDVVTAHAGAGQIARFQLPTSPVLPDVKSSARPSRSTRPKGIARGALASTPRAPSRFPPPSGTRAVAAVFPEVHEALGRGFPQEWLLRCRKPAREHILHIRAGRPRS